MAQENERDGSATNLPAVIPLVTLGGEAADPPAKAKSAKKPGFRKAARDYARDALDELHRLALNANSEAVRVSAANALLDRGIGRPAQAVKALGERSPKKADEVTLVLEWRNPTKT